MTTKVEQGNEDNELIGLPLDMLDKDLTDSLTEKIKLAHTIKGGNAVVWDTVMRKADDYINGKQSLSRQ